MAEQLEHKGDPVTHVKCLGGTCKNKRCKSCVDFPNADINPGLLKVLCCLSPSSCIIVVMKGASATQSFAQPAPMYYIGSFGGTECGVLTLNSAINPTIAKMLYFDFQLSFNEPSAACAAAFSSGSTTLGNFAGNIALNLSDVSAIWQTQPSLCSCYLAIIPSIGNAGGATGGSTTVTAGTATAQAQHGKIKP
jgi:hypothetical protein